MSIISETIFVESKTLRQQQLEELNDERSLLILNKVKSLLVALWKDKERVTTSRFAYFFRGWKNGILFAPVLDGILLVKPKRE